MGSDVISEAVSDLFFFKASAMLIAAYTANPPAMPAEKLTGSDGN